MTTFINTFQKSKIDKLSTINEFILSELVKEEEKTKCDIQEMYDKLRVLYGHPTNRKILEEMEEQFYEFFSMNTEMKMKKTIDPLKVNL